VVQWKRSHRASYSIQLNCRCYCNICPIWIFLIMATSIWYSHFLKLTAHHINSQFELVFQKFYKQKYTFPSLSYKNSKPYH
jgi:hypothetical protein